MFPPSGVTVSLPLNVSLEGKTWTEWSPDHPQQPPPVKEEELKWEKEPGTQITVTIKEEDETDGTHGQKIGEDKHQILKEAKEDKDQGGSNEGKQGHEEGQDKKMKKENETRDEEQITEEIQGIDQPITPSLDTLLATFSPQYFSSTINPSLITTNTQTPADVPQTNPDIADQNLSHSGTYTSHFSALKNTSVLLTNENGVHENSSLGLIENSEDNVDATAMAARAGPTAMSLPSKPKPSTKPPKIRDKQMPKTKQNKLQKKVKDKGNKSLTNATQMKKFTQDTDQLTTAPYFPYFKDHYCPLECACYGRWVSNTTLHMLSLTSTYDTSSDF